jgi:hypothetical protein
MTIVAKVNRAGGVRSKVENQQDLRLRSALTSREINKLDDIDVSNLQDGSVLIYSTNSSKWEASTLLEKQTVEGGQY